MNFFARSAGIALVLACFWLAAPAQAEPEVPTPAEGYSSGTLHRREAVERANRPNWAVEIAGSPQAFGSQGLLSSHPTSNTMASSLQIEYQPGFIQRFGTLGIGPIVAAYPITKGEGVTSGFFSLWSVGAAARYQGRFTNQQFLVPSVGYEVERMSYSFTTGQQGVATLAGPVVGLEFLLNSLDPRRGSDLYEASGISHTYLVGELRDLTGADSVVNAAGLTWFFGLRFEM